MWELASRAQASIFGGRFCTLAHSTGHQEEIYPRAPFLDARESCLGGLKTTSTVVLLRYLGSKGKKKTKREGGKGTCRTPPPTVPLGQSASLAFPSAQIKSDIVHPLAVCALHVLHPLSLFSVQYLLPRLEPQARSEQQQTFSSSCIKTSSSHRALVSRIDSPRDGRWKIIFSARLLLRIRLVLVGLVEQVVGGELLVLVAREVGLDRLVAVEAETA